MPYWDLLHFSVGYLLRQCGPLGWQHTVEGDHAAEWTRDYCRHACTIQLHNYAHIYEGIADKDVRLEEIIVTEKRTNLLTDMDISMLM